MVPLQCLLKTWVASLGGRPLWDSNPIGLKLLRSWKVYRYQKTNTGSSSERTFGATSTWELENTTSLALWSRLWKRCPPCSLFRWTTGSAGLMGASRHIALSRTSPLTWPTSVEKLFAGHRLRFALSVPGTRGVPQPTSCSSLTTFAASAKTSVQRMNCFKRLQPGRLCSWTLFVFVFAGGWNPLKKMLLCSLQDSFQDGTL